MARTFNDVLREVKAQSEPQRKTVLSQIAALPGQQTAEESGLEAKKTQAYDEILGGARRRGLGFSGIPLGEQAQYNATDYAPALANLKSTYSNRQSTLESALADIGSQNYMTAQEIFGRDRAFEYQKEQDRLNRADAQRASGASSTFSPTLGQGGETTTPTARLQQRADKGFNFQDASGRSISAAQYAQIKNIPFRSLLSQMAKAGDKGAQQALGYVGDDFGYNRAKVGTNQNIAKLLNSLLWGVNTPQANRNFGNSSGSVGANAANNVLKRLGA